jgi:hypothetical protein
VNENYSRKRPRLEDTKVKDDGVSKSGFFLTGFQMVLCIICLVAALALKQYGGGYYTIAKKYVKNALQNNITSEEVTQVLHSIRDQFPDAAEVFSNGVTVSSSAKEDAQSSTESETSSSSKSITSSSKSSKALFSVSTLAASTSINVWNCLFDR